jgi:hypothetical protein
VRPPLEGEGGALMQNLVGLITVLLVSVGAARAELADVASDTELRVGYCLGVAQEGRARVLREREWLGLPEGDPVQEALHKSIRMEDERIERLGGYLRARGIAAGVRSVVAIRGVLAAKKRGELDSAQSSQAISRCVTKCRGPDLAFSQRCADDCSHEDAAYRAVLRCRDDNPLPY